MRMFSRLGEIVIYVWALGKVASRNGEVEVTPPQKKESSKTGRG